MVVRQGFFSFFNCSSRFLSKLRSAKLYSKINTMLNTCFVLRISSILHLAFRSAILSTLSFEMVLCHPWQFLLVLHDSQVVRNELIKSIISLRSRYLFDQSIYLLELSWVRFHLKAFPKECC